MDEFGFTLSPSAGKSAVSAFDTSQRPADATSAIQQADVSSSRPALLAQDALGPLLFEVRCRVHSRPVLSLCGEEELAW